MTLLVGILTFVAIVASAYHFESLIDPGPSIKCSNMDPLEWFIFRLEPELDRIANFSVSVAGLILAGVAYKISPALGLVPPIALGIYTVLRLKAHSIWPF